MSLLFFIYLILRTCKILKIKTKKNLFYGEGIIVFWSNNYYILLNRKINAPL